MVTFTTWLAERVDDDDDIGELARNFGTDIAHGCAPSPAIAEECRMHLWRAHYVEHDYLAVLARAGADYAREARS